VTGGERREGSQIVYNLNRNRLFHHQDMRGVSKQLQLGRGRVEGGNKKRKKGLSFLPPASRGEKDSADPSPLRKNAQLN